MRELVLGGMKSGKSLYAESQAQASGAEVVYVATARAGDGEMAERIAAHRARRPSHWRTVEAGDDLAGVLRACAADDRCVLVDCLTLWLTALVERPESWRRARQDLLTALPGLAGRIVLVSNEVGQGVVPLGELSRRFVDEAGRLHQAVAARCERVTLVTAGLPLTLKETT